MQYSLNGEWDEQGTFVYKIIKRCAVRSLPDVGDCHRTRNNDDFKNGDLVSVDLICTSRFKNSTNGPFLRLVDRSGWLFERKHGEDMLEKIPVETGLWKFYVDNYPAGIALRRHPIDSEKQLVKPDIIFFPMQKIFCDKRVVSNSGVNFYRVQGTDGWVFDKRRETHMLIPESMVRTGFFVYQNIHKRKLIIRSKTNVGEEYKTKRSIKVDDIVIVDVVCKSPLHDSGDGPFLRLTDGTGWLFKRENYEQMMEELPIVKGLWKFQPVNSSGITTKFNQIDSQKKLSSSVYNENEQFICNKMIASPSGINFYQVKGTRSWVFDERDENIRMEKAPYVDGTNGGNISSVGSWTPEFVRGVVAAVGGLKEVLFDEHSCLISFCNNDSVRFNIYYTTKNIGIAMDHPQRNKEQPFRRNCSDAELTEILRNEYSHISKDYQYEQSHIINGWKSSDVETDEELNLRKSLLLCDKEAMQLQNRKIMIMKSILVHSKKRASAAKRMDLKRDAQIKILQAEVEEKQRQIEVENQQLGEKSFSA